MGLDGVELVMAWEEAFGIDIPTDVAASLRTPRDAVDYIYRHLPHSAGGACVTQRAFYSLRRGFVAALPAYRRSVGVQTRLEELVPRRGRRKAWAFLPKATGLSNWPDLQRPAWVSAGLAITALTIAIGLPLAHFTSIVTALSAAAITLVAGFWGTQPFAVEFSRYRPTVGGLARYLAEHNTSRLLSPTPGWTRGQVRERVRATIVESLGVPPGFDDNAEFVRDLGVD